MFPHDGEGRRVTVAMASGCSVAQTGLAIYYQAVHCDPEVLEDGPVSGHLTR